MSSSACDPASLLLNSGSGITPRNLEHRRVNACGIGFEPTDWQDTNATELRAVGRELREKHWFSSQPSTNGSLLKELFPQRHS
jgi:hypothetical protein